MKILVLIIILIANSACFSQNELIGLNKYSIRNYNEISKAYTKNWKGKDIKKIKGRKQYQRFQNFWKYRTDNTGYLPSTKVLLNEYKRFKTENSKNDNVLSNEKWNLRGPFIPSLNDAAEGVGRINCIAFSPTDSLKIWAGSASGGLWTSSDKGNTWRVAPETDFMAVGVSDIAISKSDPNIMYIATGDADGGRFFGSFSLGILKSTDAGATWNATGFVNQFLEQSFVSKILINRNDPDILFASASTGFYKSTDGGNSWRCLIDGVFFIDMTFSPDNESVIWASTFDANGSCSIFKTEDVGNTWYIMKTILDAARIKLACDPFDSEVVYALTSHYQTTGSAGLYITKNAGISWDTLHLNTDIVEKQGYYNLALACSPYKQGELFAGGVQLYKISLNDAVIKPIRFGGAIHVDQHCLTFNPHDSSLYVGNDGGVYQLDDKFENSKPLNKYLSITQFYNLNVNEFARDNIFAGSQDNGFWEMRDSAWTLFSHGDGMKIECSPNLPLKLYCAEPTANLIYFQSGEAKHYNLQEINEKQNWETAFCVDKSRPDTVYIAKENVYRISVQKDTLHVKLSNFNDDSPICKLEIGTINPNILYAANGQFVYYSNNSGETWSKLTDTRGYLSSLLIDESKPRAFWWTVAGFDANSKIFYYNGDSTINLTYNAPNIPFNKIIHDSISKTMYTASDFGVMELDLINQKWNLVGSELPPTIITDLVINYGSGELFASTFGRGAWSIRLRNQSRPKPEFEMIGSNPICEGSETKFRILNPIKDVKYIWSDGTVGTEAIIDAGDFKNSPFSLWVSANYNDGTISTSKYLDVLLDYKINESIFLLSNNPICEGESAKLGFYGFEPLKKRGYQIIWNTGDTGAVISPKLAGEYYIDIISPNGCNSRTNSVFIEVNPVPAKPLIYQQGKKIVTDNNPGLQFQWVKDDYIVTGGNNNFLDLIETGDYKLIVTDSNYCQNVSNVLRAYINPIDSSSDASVIIYPNPAINNVKIQAFSYEKRNLDISIYDLLGNKLFNFVENNINNVFVKEFDFSKFAQGTYYIEYNFGALSGRTAIIKVR